MSSSVSILFTKSGCIKNVFFEGKPILVSAPRFVIFLILYNRWVVLYDALAIKILKVGLMWLI